MSESQAGGERGHLFVVSAPSGAGKTSLIQALAAGDPMLTVSISHTTRAKRPGETDGEHYHFVTPATFAAMRNAGEFLEWATVFDHAYGTSRKTVMDAVREGRDVILEIDWQGAAQVRERWPHPVSIFVLPPSRETLGRRLRRRGQDGAETIAKRTAAAVTEMSHHDEFDHLVVNDDFGAALATLGRIVQATRNGEPLPRASHQRLLRELLSAN